MNYFLYKIVEINFENYQGSKNMLQGKTPVNLYNGSTLRFPRKCTRFEQMSIIANNLRVSPELFKFSTLFCNNSYCLPYSKKQTDSHAKGTIYYRFVTDFLDLEDIAHKCPEVFNYLYLQAVQDFKTLSGPLENKEIFSQIVALKLATLGICSVSVVLLHRTLSLLGLKTLIASDFVEYVSKSLNNCKVNIISVKCDLIRIINSLNSWPSCVYDCTINNSAAVMEITSSSLIFTKSSSEVIKLRQIDKVQFNFKVCSATLLFVENAASKVELNLLTRTKLESFLTILDMAFKVSCPGDQILDHKLADDFNTESLVYHDPDFVVQISNEDGETESHFNYSLVDKCDLVIKINDKAEAEKIICFPGNETKFLVTDNFLAKEHSKIVSQYFLFLFFGDRLISHRISMIGGRYKIDEQQGYLSLYKMFSKITLMDKKAGCGQRQKFIDRITSEDLMRLSDYNIIHCSKGEAIFSPVNVALEPLSLSTHYLYTLHKGVLHTPSGILRPVHVTQLITHNSDYRSFILGPLIANVKNIQSRRITHENLMDVLGVYRFNHMPCVVEERYGIPLDLHVSASHFSVELLHGLGKQIVCGLLYLHKSKIIHGFPALHNIKIVNQHVKLGFTGILPELVKCRDVYNSLLLRDYITVDSQSCKHPARWLHRSMIVSNAPWNVEVDR